MSIPYTSEDFTTPRAGGDSWVEYPFIEYGDNSSKVYHMRCTVNKDDYTAIALDTTMASASNADVLTLPFAADTSAYFVGDFNHRVKDGALLEFDRQFATIPATNEDYPGTEFFTFPGLPGTSSVFNVNVTSKSYSAGTTTFITASNHGMSSGSFYKLYYSYYSGSNIISAVTFLTCTSGTSGTTVKSTSNIGSLNFASTAVINPNSKRGRDPVNLSGTIRLTNDYFLPGITSNISTLEDVVLFETFQPYNSYTGNYTNDLLYNTTPTDTQYNTSIINKDYLLIDCAIQRYKGNIYVRKTKEIISR